MSKHATCGSCGERSSSDLIGRQVVRLVQRRERNVFFEGREDLRVHADGTRVFASTVHDAVADADQPVFGIFRTQERDQVFERAVVAELDPVAP